MDRAKDPRSKMLSIGCPAAQDRLQLVGIERAIGGLPCEARSSPDGRPSPSGQSPQGQSGSVASDRFESTLKR